MSKKRKSSFPSNITHLPEVEGQDIECPIKLYGYEIGEILYDEVSANEQELPFAEEEYFKGEKDETLD